MNATQSAIVRVERRPPPLWFVTNGELTVGPVRTDLLARGVWFGRIPDDCQVRELTWRAWRALEQVREVAVVKRARDAGAASMPAIRPASELVLRARLARAADPAEVLTLALHECAKATGATFGAVHRAWTGAREPLTTVVRGIGMSSRLGRSVSPSDPALALARFGGVVMAPPDAGTVERAIASRFGGPADLGGVAMVPVISERHLLAVIELGRVAHPFRAADVAVLERVARAATGCITAFSR